jgi:protein-L-isoaspartate(D-aspartate) O-methyltransferase
MISDAGKIRLLMELRGQGITDTRVLNALETTPRDLFVPDHLQDQAWENTALPIGRGQTISQPAVVALMTARLQLTERMRVLEIGTGSGYQAAILSRLARRVYTIERHRELVPHAQTRFDALGLHNISTRVGDGSRGWPEAAPFDRIIVTAAARRVPPRLLDQLGPGGIMVIPVGESTWDQKLLRITRNEQGFDEEVLMDVRFVPLIEGSGEPTPDS